MRAMMSLTAMFFWMGCAPEVEQHPESSPEADAVEQADQALVPVATADGFAARHGTLKANVNFTAEGMTFRSDNFAHEPVTLRSVALNGQALGRPEFARAACDDDQALKDCTSRLEAQHGAVTEWWVNSEAGLQQGWTVHEPTGGDQVRIDVAVDGARTRVDESGNAAAILRPTGSPLHYTGLEAWDANGETLTARMVSSAHGLTIKIDTDGAVFPVTIDPWLGSWEFGSGQESAYLGVSVSSAGDVNGDGVDDIVIGANGEGTSEGRVYVILGPSSGARSLASADATFTGEVTGELDNVGARTAGVGDIDGNGLDDILISGSKEDTGGTDAGSVYLLFAQ